MTRLALLLALLAQAGLASTALAQPERDAWLVLPIVSGELSAAEEQLAEACEGALAQRQSALTAPPTADLGSNPRPFPADLETRLGAPILATLDDAAFGRPSRVFATVMPLLDGAGQHLDALGGQPVAVRHVTDLGLIVGRVHLKGRDAPASRAGVERLLSLVPNPDPTIEHHPHPALVLLSRARELLRDGSGDGSIHVTTSDRGACNVYLNGQLAGPTPLRISVYAGNYAVRVECGAIRSRVHLVHVERGDTSLEISTSLEAALETMPRLHLRYEEPVPDRALADTAAVMRPAGAERALLIRTVDGTTRVEVAHLGGGSVTIERSVELTLPAEVTEIERAWRMLLDEPPGSGAGGGDAPVWDIAIGVALLAAGATALISPLYTLARLDGCADDPPDPAGCRQVVGFGPINITLAFTGIVALVGGATWLATSPIHLAVSSDGSSASLVLGGTF